MIEATVDNIDNLLKNNNKIVIDFWATWCGPCKNQLKILEQLQTTHTDVTFCKINIDDESQLVERFGIKSVPTIIIKNSEKIITLNGLQQPQNIIKLL